ncbi:hypothetical protein E4U61_003006 [Claviceps capensis]|nr:hypothetical protein E4U61_003006 [Claviceps capensis]
MACAIGRMGHNFSQVPMLDQIPGRLFKATSHFIQDESLCRTRFCLRCPGLATTVQPLEPAPEARDVLTSDFDVRGAYLDLDTDSEAAGLEARSGELEDAEGLNKRAYLFRRVVKIPEISHGTKPPTPMPVELCGVRFMFLMEERQTMLESELQSEWYCNAIRVSNLTSTRRLAIMRTSRRSIFRRVMNL